MRHTPSSPRRRVATLAAALAGFVLATPGAAQQGDGLLPPGSVDTLFTRDPDGAALAAGAATLPDLLAGLAPWLHVDRRSGVPGEAAALWLREATWDGAPVVVFVDGVRMDGLPVSLLRQRTPDPLLDVDPRRVQRVELVRGPVAAARWGSDAAGGVLLVTTLPVGQAPGLTQAVSAELGFASPREVGPVWWTCTGGEALAECDGEPAGTVVTADPLARTGLLDTRPLHRIAWRAGWAKDRLTVAGSAATEERQGTVGADGFGRRSAGFHARAAPGAGVRIALDAAVATMRIDVRRFQYADIECMAVDWPIGSDPAEPAPWCFFATSTDPLGDLTTRALDRQVSRVAARVVHRLAPWLEHEAALTRYRSDDAGREDWAFTQEATEFRGEFDAELRSVDYAVRGRAVLGGGWSLAADAGARREWSDRMQRRRYTAYTQPEPAVAYAELRSELDRRRVRAGVQLGWRDRAVVAAGLLHEDGQGAGALRSVVAGEDRPLLASLAASYSFGLLRARASWGRSRANLHTDDVFDPGAHPASFHFAEVGTTEAAVDVGRERGRVRGTLAFSRTRVRNERIQGVPIMLHVWTTTTDALEAAVSADLLHTPELRWVAALAALAPLPRGAAAEAPIIATDGSGLVIRPGERHDAFWIRPIIGVDTAAGYAEIGSELVTAGYATPRLAATLRSGIQRRGVRLDALAQLRWGESALNEWAFYRDLLRTSELANDRTLSTSDRLRRFGPFYDGRGLSYIHSGQYIEPTTYLRLRSLALTLALPARLLGLPLPAGDLVLAGRDLWTWSRFHGADPEVPSLAAPHPRVWVSALTLRF